MNTKTYEDIIANATSPEEMLLAFLMGAPINEEFFEAQRKLYEVCE